MPTNIDQEKTRLAREVVRSHPEAPQYHFLCPEGMGGPFDPNGAIFWEYLRPFYKPNPQWTEELEDCGCPDFFKLGDRWMLVCISHPRGARYYLGRYEDGRFFPEEHHRMNWPGGSCFAPESLLDGQGRRIMWAWVLDQRPRPKDTQPPWAWKVGADTEEDGFGVFTMPRVLSLDGQGRLQIDPPTEFESLRRNPRQCSALTLAEGQETTLTGIAGDVMEVALEASVPASGVFGLKVRKSPDGSEQTIIRVDCGKRTLSVDTTRSSLSPHVYQRYPIANAYGKLEVQEDVRVQDAPFELAPDEPLQLHVFLDKSIVEVYANRRQCVTQRIYPTRPDSLGVAVFCRGGTATVHSVQAWDLRT